VSRNVFSSVWDDIKDKLKELGWSALLVFLRWLIERWTSSGGNPKDDADTEK